MKKTILIILTFVFIGMGIYLLVFPDISMKSAFNYKDNNNPTNHSQLVSDDRQSFLIPKVRNQDKVSRCEKALIKAKKKLSDDSPVAFTRIGIFRCLKTYDREVDEMNYHCWHAVFETRECYL